MELNNKTVARLESHLINSFLPYVSKKAHTFGYSEDWYDHMCQTGLILVFEAYKAYKFNRKSKFSTWVINYVDWNIKIRFFNDIRGRAPWAKKTTPVQVTVPLSALKEKPYEVTKKSMDMMPEANEDYNKYKAMVNHLNEINLSEQAVEVAILTADGHTRGEIVERLNLTANAYTRLMQEIRLKI